MNQSIEEAFDVAKQAKELSVEIDVIQCDVSSPDQVKEMVESVVRRYGKIDILVNNAGITHGSAAEDLSFQDWKRTLQKNARAHNTRKIKAYESSKQYLWI